LGNLLFYALSLYVMVFIVIYNYVIVNYLSYNGIVLGMDENNEVSMTELKRINVVVEESVWQILERYQREEKHKTRDQALAAILREIAKIRGY